MTDIRAAAQAGDWQAVIDAVHATEGQPVPLDHILLYAEALEMTGSPDKSEAIVRSLYAADPQPQIAKHLAGLCCRLLVNDGTIDRLIADHPDVGFLQAAASELAMSVGDLDKGLRLAHNRWSVSVMPAPILEVNCPRWDGEPFDGRLIVVPEQGLGDEILFSCAFSRLPAGTVVGCDYRLLDLFRRSFPALNFVDKRAVRYFGNEGTRAVEAFDLLRIYGIRGNDRPWLVADQGRSDYHRMDFATHFTDRPIVGISWASARQRLGPAKSVPILDFRPLMESCCCISLQYGRPLADWNAVEAAGLPLYGVTGLDERNDLDGVAAVIMACDGIVTSSSTLAHLAGALGKRTVVLVPGGRFVLWYWGWSGDRTPWYPNTDILRGPPIASWLDLTHSVAETITAGFNRQKTDGNG